MKPLPTSLLKLLQAYRTLSTFPTTFSRFLFLSELEAQRIASWDPHPHRHSLSRSPQGLQCIQTILLELNELDRFAKKYPARKDEPVCLIVVHRPISPSPSPSLSPGQGGEHSRWSTDSLTSAQSGGSGLRGRVERGGIPSAEPPMRGLEAALERTSWGKRVRWAVVDRKLVEQHLARLTTAIDTLYALFPPAQRKLFEISFHPAPEGAKDRSAHKHAKKDSLVNSSISYALASAAGKLELLQSWSENTSTQQGDVNIQQEEHTNDDDDVLQYTNDDDTATVAECHTYPSLWQRYLEPSHFSRDSSSEEVSIG